MPDLVSGSDKGQEKESMKKSFYQKLSRLIFVFTLLVTSLVFLSCENFAFGGNLREELDKDIGVSYYFYEYPDDESAKIDVTYMIGQDLYADKFPSAFEHENEVLAGWEFYKKTDSGSTVVPKYIRFDEHHLTFKNIQSVYVNPESISLSAIWRKKCTVTLVTNMDFTLDPVIVPEGERFESPNFERRRGIYAFDGWYYDQELTRSLAWGIPITEDLTLYAKWVEAYNVTYHKNDGSNEKSVHWCERNKEMSFDDCMFGSRTGYGFVGWATSKDGGVTYYSGDRAVISGDMDLYAVWTTDIITISYIDTSSNFASKSAQYGRGAHITVGRVLGDEGRWYDWLFSIWKREGMTLVGFDTSSSVATNANGLPITTYNQEGRYNSDSGTSNFVVANSDMTFYVFWKDKTYSVRFLYINPNNPGSGVHTVNVSTTAPNDRIIVGWNQKLTRPTAVPPTILGYEFDDWYMGDGDWNSPHLYSTPFNFNVTFNDESMNGRTEIRLYAKFNAVPSGGITGTISFDPASTAGSDISVSGPEVSDSYVSFTAPASFSTYEWKVNGTLQSLMTSHIAVFDTSSWATGRHDIDLEVTDYSGNYYSWHGQIVKN